MRGVFEDWDSEVNLINVCAAIWRVCAMDDASAPVDVSGKFATNFAQGVKRQRLVSFVAPCRKLVRMIGMLAVRAALRSDSSKRKWARLAIIR